MAATLKHLISLQFVSYHILSFHLSTVGLEQFIEGVILNTSSRFFVSVAEFVSDILVLEYMKSI